MKVIIRDNAKQGSLWAAHYIAAKINEKAKVSDKPFVLGLCTGSTPIDTYAELIRMVKAGEVSFKLFDHIDEPAENIHILDGNAADTEAECAAYEQAIVEAGGFDLFLGGVGEDGHIAFNEPFSSLSSRTRVVTLTQDTREVNARFFGGDPEAVPAQALTVGVATVLSSKEVVILAFGSKKARALKDAIEGPMSHYCTLSGLQNHPAGTIVCDEASIGEVKVNSYRYFKAVEAAENR